MSLKEESPSLERDSSIISMSNHSPSQLEDSRYGAIIEETLNEPSLTPDKILKDLSLSYTMDMDSEKSF